MTTVKIFLRSNHSWQQKHRLTTKPRCIPLCHALGWALGLGWGEGSSARELDRVPALSFDGLSGGGETEQMFSVWSQRASFKTCEGPWVQEGADRGCLWTEMRHEPNPEDWGESPLPEGTQAPWVVLTRSGSTGPSKHKECLFQLQKMSNP